MNEKKYQLFACCQIVSGSMSSLIYDIQRFQIHRITNEQAKVLRKPCFHEYEIESIFQFLLEKDLIFELISEELIDCFPPIDFSYKSPYFITNCVIEREKLHENMSPMISFLSEIGGRYFVLIVDSISYGGIKEFLLSIYDEPAYRIQLVVLNFNDGLNLDKIEELLRNQHVIDSVSFVYSNFKPETIYFSWISNFYEERQSFRLNMKLFSESKSYNNYFNQKIYIDKKGNIKNGIFSDEFFGNINDFNSPDQLKKYLIESRFTSLWKINKDKIDVCKDCEFKYMCVDNRLPYSRNEDEWYHVSECDYNPYICKRKDEEGHRTLVECGVISNKEGFIIDNERIATINEALWK
jgi:hypothetical protein